MFGVGPGHVRRMIEQRELAAIRVQGVLKVPTSFILNDEPLSFLRGTLVVLGDAGFSNDEAVNWLLSENEILGTTPIDALRNGRKAEVRRVALALAF